METAPALEIGIQSTQSQLTAELFHALNQPLTALHCLFELALHAPRSADEYRNYLQTGLAKTAQAVALSSGMRELLEAAEPCGASRTISMQYHVREAVEHFLPVANDAGTAITLHCPGDSMVASDPDHLRRALFYMLDLSLPFARNELLAIQVREAESDVILELACKIQGARVRERLTQVFCATQSISVNEDYWKQRLKWMIAQQLFRSGGGSLSFVSRDNFLLQARLRLSATSSST
jgi:signal transduction histidine kinase